MNISKVMGIGIGRAGNVLLDEFLKIDGRLKGLYVNSAYGDFEGLAKLSPDTNTYIFSGTNGSGRDRGFAQTMMADNWQGLAEYVMKYPMHDTIVVFFSMDGGTGSGITPKTLQIIKRGCPDKKIIAVGIVPDANKADKISLENTINCWNELLDGFEANNVDSIILIDNSKRDTFKEVNKKAVSDIYDALNMNGKCEEGSIDDRDARRTLTAHGFGYILSLGEGLEIPTAISQAMQSSVFAIPNSYVCDFLAISTKDYRASSIVNEFEIMETSYVAHNEEHNTIVLGGCEEPSEVIENIKLAYDKLINQRPQRDKIKRTVVNITPPNTNNKTKTEDTPQKTRITAKEMNSLFEGLF